MVLLKSELVAPLVSWIKGVPLTGTTSRTIDDDTFVMKDPRSVLAHAHCVDPSPLILRQFDWPPTVKASSR
jgi:hypothetical protein